MEAEIVRSLGGGSDCKTFVAKYSNDTLVVRKIEKKSISNKIPNQYQWLKDYQGLSVIPKVMHFEENLTCNILDIEYFDDFNNTDFAIDDHANILISVLEYCRENIHRNDNQENASFEKYISDKVIGKIRDCINILPESETLFKENLMINNKEHRSIARCIEIMKNNSSNSKFKRIAIHGDLTFENILLKGKAFRLIDPNPNNPVSSLPVEVGKILQSLHGQYELIKQSYFSLNNNKDIQYEINSTKHSCQLELFENYIQKNFGDAFLEACYFHESIHFCRLLPYRAVYNPKSFPLYVVRTAELLNRVSARVW